jgi:two-component system sensor histidine kinase GlrK
VAINTHLGTILRRLFVSLSLVSVPMGAGLVVATYRVEDFAHQTLQGVDDLTVALSSGDAVLRIAEEMELRGADYLLVPEEGYLRLLKQSSAELQRHLERLNGHFPAGDVAVAVARTDELRQQLLQRVQTDQDPRREGTREAVREFERLPSLAREVRGLAVSFVSQEFNDLREAGETNVRVLSGLVVGLFGLTLLLVFVFALRLYRPIRRINDAIQRLGTGNFTDPVQVEGPDDIKALAARLEWLRCRLQELNEQKERFLLHMSHELKTPVTSLNEGVQLLQEEVVGPLNAAQQDVTRILYDNVYHLRRLLENFINFQSVGLPHFQPRRQQFRLDELVRSVVDGLELIASRKRVGFDLLLPALTYEGDAERVRLIVSNLLSNAVKFSPQGGKVRFSLSELDGSVRFRVSDQGPGIPPHERERVFEPFYQGQTTSDTPLKGSGLGLSIVKECVDSHGGEIRLRDDLSGTVFELTLPHRTEAERVA